MKITCLLFLSLVVPIELGRVDALAHKLCGPQSQQTSAEQFRDRRASSRWKALRRTTRLTATLLTRITRAAVQA